MVEWTRGRRERFISSWWSLILTAAAAGATLAILTKHNTFFRVALFFCCCCCSLFSINSIQFNSLCAILRAPVCEYIFMYPFMKMCTQPGLTRQTSQETFARCLSFFFFCTKDFALNFCAGFYAVFFFVHVRFFRTVFNLNWNNTLQSGWYVWKVDSIRLMSFCHSKIKFTLLL